MSTIAAAKTRFADGIVITSSHNPPRDGGFKYNPPNGGPADTDVTAWIQNRANNLLCTGNAEVRRMPFSSLVYGLDITVVNPVMDPTFSFMTVDPDGEIRMDCSSPYAMARLVSLKDEYRVAFANDPDSDRHGIVTPSSGLMNPNHYLAVAIRCLLTHRPSWSEHATVGKTLVSSSLIDQVVKQLGRKLTEVPVGFKWFVPRFARRLTVFWRGRKRRRQLSAP